ncbi:unnamed protein product, partial [Prorocentrum cordatum]
GMLVVESFLPSTEAEEKLRPGDVLMEVAGQVCTDFASLESWLDSHVGSDVAVRLSRAGKMVDASLAVADLHALIPYDFVECAGGVFHQRSYHTCKRYHIPISDQGIFVVQSGFGFGLELPYHAVIVAVAGQQVSSLADFESALAIVADNETFEGMPNFSPGNFVASRQRDFVVFMVAREPEDSLDVEADPAVGYENAPGRGGSGDADQAQLRDQVLPRRTYMKTYLSDHSVAMTANDDAKHWTIYGSAIPPETEGDEDFLAGGRDGPLVSAGRPAEAAGGRPVLDSLLSASAASAYAPQCGISASKWHETCDAAAHATFQVLRDTFEQFAKSLIGVCRANVDGSGVATPMNALLQLRFLSCDGTKQMVRVLGKFPVPDRCGRSLAEGLWNGNLRRSGRDEHLCRGCCKSRHQTLYLMQTCGLRALTKHVGHVIDRQNWAGADLCLGGLGAASFVHNLLPSAFVAVFGGMYQDTPDGGVAGDGQGGDIGMVDGDADAEKVIPVSVWREGNKVKIPRTIYWIVSCEFHDGLYIFTRAHGPCSEMLLRELERSGVEWELKQQRRLLVDGERTYPLWEAADRRDVKQFREQLGSMLFDDAWPALARPTESQQLVLFVLCSRLSASACELVEVRHSKTPYLTRCSLRDLEALRALERSPRCTLDARAEDFMASYSDRGGADGRMAKVELSGALPLMQTNSAAIERTRSESQFRGARGRALGRFHSFTEQQREPYKDPAAVATQAALKAALERERDAARAAAAHLHQRSDADSPGLGQEWDLVAGDLAASPAAGLSMMQSMVPSLQCTRATSSLVSEVLRALDVITRHILGDKTFSQKLEDGVFVLRLTCVGVPMHEPPPQSVADPSSAIVADGQAPGAEWLLHVAFQCARPWRPTFSRARWEPLEDRAGILGVAPERDDAGGAGLLLHDPTVFEVARKCFDAAWTKRPIHVQVHELVADGRRAQEKEDLVKGSKCGPGPKPKASPVPALERDSGGSTDEMGELGGMPAVEDDDHADVARGGEPEPASDDSFDLFGWSDGDDMSGVCGIPVGGELGSGDPGIPPPPGDDGGLFEAPAMPLSPRTWALCAGPSDASEPEALSSATESRPWPSDLLSFEKCTPTAQSAPIRAAPAPAAPVAPQGGHGECGAADVADGAQDYGGGGEAAAQARGAFGGAMDVGGRGQAPEGAAVGFEQMVRSGTLEPFERGGIIFYFPSSMPGPQQQLVAQPAPLLVQPANLRAPVTPPLAFPCPGAPRPAMGARCHPTFRGNVARGSRTRSPCVSAPGCPLNAGQTTFGTFQPDARGGYSVMAQSARDPICAGMTAVFGGSSFAATPIVGSVRGGQQQSLPSQRHRGGLPVPRAPGLQAPPQAPPDHLLMTGPLVSKALSSLVSRAPPVPVMQPPPAQAKCAILAGPPSFARPPSGPSGHQPY